MAALIMLHILSTTFTTSVARGRYLTGIATSEGGVKVDDSRTSSWKLACQRADTHGVNGFVHDTHTDATFTSAERAGINTTR